MKPGFFSGFFYNFCVYLNCRSTPMIIAFNYLIYVLLCKGQALMCKGQELSDKQPGDTDSVSSPEPYNEDVYI